MMQHSADRDGASLDIGAAFADPAFTALKSHGAAFAIVRPGTRGVVWANASAGRLWAAGDAGAMASALFGTEGRGGWLDGLTRGAVPGRAPHLARTGLAPGFRMRASTALIRAWTAPDGGVLLGFAVADPAISETAAADAWRQPAWRTDPPAIPVPAAGADATAQADEPAGRDETEAGNRLAQRGRVAVLRDRLAAALDGATALRLVWRTDARDAVTQIDAAILARLGAPMRFDEGRFPDIVAAFDPAGAARLATALASRVTWSGLTLDLPVSDAAATVPLRLGASPIFGSDRCFAGFRGFATLDLGRLALVPPRARIDPDGPDAAPPAPEPDAGDLAAAAAGAAATQALPDVLPDTPPPESLPPPANVVHLRAFQALASGRFGMVPVPAPAADPLPDPTSLPASTSDASHEDDPQRSEAVVDAGALSDDLAFVALGEALRAQIGAMPDAAGGAAPVTVDEAGEAPAVAAETAPPSLLDQLPMALLVMAGRVPVYANAPAAARLGYASPQDLAAAGDDLMALPPAGPEGGVLALRHAQGHALALTGRTAAVAFAGAPATLWILEEPADGALTPARLAGGRGDPARAEDSEGDDERGDDVGVRAIELLDRVDDAVALLDGNGRIRRLNRRGEGWFGREAVLGQSVTQLLAAESRPTALALLGEVRHQRDGLGLPPLNREVIARTGDAAATPMLLTLGRLGATGFYATLRDVTALKRAETERARSEHDQARDADRLSGMLARVSHDIRTPLNAILGFAEVMMDERFGPLGNPRYKDYLKDIHASGTQVMTLVEGLLDLSRIEAGHLDLDVAAVDVNRIVAETVAQMQPEAHRARVIMRTSLGWRIPAVLADERSARQIVRNLLSNAVKFNEPGGQVIVSTALSDNGTVVLRVRDTGVGMTDDEIAAALEPFGGRAATPAANGNGLGLPLTRALVGANGASMAIRSRPHDGTLVEVTFTSAPAEDARLPA